MTASRRSPVHDRLEAAGARFVERNRMPVASRLGDADEDRAKVLGLADVSHLAKTGFKGSNAAAWVRSQGFELPEPNAWADVEGGGLLARLANSEFFLEDGEHGSTAARLRTLLGEPVSGVYPVLRQDAGFALTGERVNELLVEPATSISAISSRPPAWW
jgi:sarcosine oxidase, subunit gamma